MICLLLVLALALGGCGLGGVGVERTRTTRVGISHPEREGEVQSYAGIRVITIRDASGQLCTLVFRDGYYIGGTC